MAGRWRHGSVLATCLVSVVACGVADEPAMVDQVVGRDVEPVALAPLELPPARELPAVTTEQARRVDPPRRSFTMAFTGDNLTHSPIVRQAGRNAGGAGFDFRPMYDQVRDVLRSVDVAVCHLETPIVPPGEALSTAPIYGVPPQVADGLAHAGYRRCSTASNHTLDRGVAGIEATVVNLERVGIAQVGMARTPAEAVAPVFTVRDVRVAHLSYTFSYNGLQPPPGEAWRSNLIDAPRIFADAADARDRGAEVVVVSLHDGNEGSAVPTTRQRSVAEAITAFGMVDLVVGHHAHVLQPIEQVNGRWVLFGLGNFISNMPTGPQWPAASQDGAIVTVTVTEQDDGSFVVEQPVVHPTWVHRDAGGWLIRLVQRDLADPATPPGLRAALQASLERTQRLLGPFLAP